MFGKIVSLASTYVVGQWASTVGQGVYEVTKGYMKYRFLDPESPGYKFKNGTFFSQKNKEEDDE